MATTNKRAAIPQAMVINGVDAGGLMQASINEGYENILQSSPDGLTLPVKDREIEYCRGSVATQDWVEFVNLLTGTVGTYAFSQRKSGTVAATGYIDHVITNPVIHRANLRVTKGGYAAVGFDFECKAADETKGFADMHAVTDSQPAPDYVSAARGGYRVTATAHGLTSINHLLEFNFTLMLPLAIACNDSDVGYTTVDAREDGMAADGYIVFEDMTVSDSNLLSQNLLSADAADLELTITQGQGATAKTVTLANVSFDTVDLNADASAVTGFSTCRANFSLENDPDTPLTISGDNKIITIA